MAIQLSLNLIGKDMDWTWPTTYISNYSIIETALGKTWSDIRTTYQELGIDYWTYDEMHPNGICMYEKLPKVSTSNDPENSVWVPLLCNNTSYNPNDTVFDGCVRINYYLVHTTTPLPRETTLSSSLSFGDCISVYIVDGVFDHAILNEYSGGHVKS